jgi:hypothetical protein
VVRADIVVVFEGSSEAYQRTEMPLWMWDFPADKFWHLVYGLSDGKRVPDILRRAVSQRAGLVYVTDGHMPNPWLALPRYWDEELARFPALAPAGAGPGESAKR